VINLEYTGGNMGDIKESLKRAMVDQGWILGDRATRIGCPFDWTENENKQNIVNLEDLLAVAFYFSMFYVKKETSPQIMVPDHDEVKKLCRDELHNIFKHFFPFLPSNDTWNNYIESQAMVRTQDYCFIKKYCENIPKGVQHLDIGPGLGSSAIYSLNLFESDFYAVEAHPMSYSVQRNVLRFLSPFPGAYLDLIECENFQISNEEVNKKLKKDSGYRIKHAPSWKFPMIQDSSMDLLTATFVLNELNYAGILWMLSNASRTLKRGGYFYIRDSTILKPGMHSIEYDNVLITMGFEKIAQLEYNNRLDHYGIPRLYRKNIDRCYSFEEMVDMCLGKFASVAGGGSRAYNLKETKPGNTESL
jgi:hypothetical protein